MKPVILFIVDNTMVFVRKSNSLYGEKNAALQSPQAGITLDRETYLLIIKSAWRYKKQQIKKIKIFWDIVVYHPYT